MVSRCREGWTDHNPVSNAFGKMWIILEPILFALIGSEVQVNLRILVAKLTDARDLPRWTRLTLSQPAVVCLFSSQLSSFE